MNKKELASILRLARKRKKMTRKILAEKMCVGPMTIYAWEIGRNEPSGLMLIELIKELDLIKVFFPQEVSVLMDQNQSQNKTNIIERQIFFNNQKSIDLS